MVFLRKTLMVLILTAPSSIYASGMMCLTAKQMEQKIQACEIQQKVNGCDQAAESFQGNYTPEEIRSMLVDCRKNPHETVVNTLKNCALPVAASIGVLSRALVTRAAGAALNVYFLADVLDAALTADKACFEDNEGKQKLLQMYNNQINEVQSYLQLSPEDTGALNEAKIHAYGDPVSIERLSNLSCTELRNQLVQKDRKLKGTIGTLLGKRKIQAAQIEEVNRLLRGEKSEDLLPGILMNCLNQETIWKYRCEIAAFRLGVSWGSYKLMKTLKPKK